MGSQIPVRTYNDWNWPPPGFLEIDLVAHCGGTLSGSFIHSLVATDICTGWTEAVPLLAREQSLVVEGLKAIAGQLPFPVLGIDSDNDSVFRALRRNSRIWPGNRALRPQGRIVPSKPIVSNRVCGIICGNIRAMVPIPADYSLKMRGDYTPILSLGVAPGSVLPGCQEPCR